MNTKKINKKQAQEFIKDIFSKPLTQKQIKKAKRIAMSKNIKLKSYKQKFCKKCLTPFTPKNSEVRIKKPFKIIKCKHCGNVGRYKLS